MAKAEREMLEEAVVIFGEPRTGVPPEVILLERVAALAGNVEFLEKVIRLNLGDAQALVWGVTEQVEGTGGDPDSSFSKMKWPAAPSTYIKMYMGLTELLTHVSKTVLPCGIAERQVRVAEDMGRIIERVLLAALAAKGIDIDQGELRAEVGRQLLLVAGKEG